MKIVERNIGPKVPFLIRNNQLELAGRLTLDLSAYELDEDNTIIVYWDRRGNLLCAPSYSSSYAAEIHIPARRYVSDQKAVYESDLPVVKKFPVPFEMQRCTLTLWAQEEING